MRIRNMRSLIAIPAIPLTLATSCVAGLATSCVAGEKGGPSGDGVDSAEDTGPIDSGEAVDRTHEEYCPAMIPVNERAYALQLLYSYTPPGASGGWLERDFAIPHDEEFVVEDFWSQGYSDRFLGAFYRYSIWRCSEDGLFVVSETIDWSVKPADQQTAYEYQTISTYDPPLMLLDPNLTDGAIWTTQRSGIVEYSTGASVPFSDTLTYTVVGVEPFDVPETGEILDALHLEWSDGAVTGDEWYAANLGPVKSANLSLAIYYEALTSEDE